MAVRATMADPSSARLLVIADLVLVAHAAFIVFVVGGQALILLGWVLRWRWTRGVWFRLVHLCAISFVVLEVWAGIACPLTWLEFRLRSLAGQPVEAASFIGHWLQRIVFYDAPSWVFTTAYTLFGALVLASLVLYPPHRNASRRHPV